MKTCWSNKNKVFRKKTATVRKKHRAVLLLEATAENKSWSTVLLESNLSAEHEVFAIKCLP